MAGPGPSYQQVNEGAESAYRVSDPTGQMQGAIDNAGSFQSFGQGMMNTNPQSYMNQFQSGAGGLANMVSGAQSPLQQQLNFLAADQARRGSEAAAQSFGDSGAMGSGAAARAMGAAFANPFAQAQAQLGGQQIDLTGNLWNNAMNQYAQQHRTQNQLAAQIAAQGMQGRTGIASQLGGLVAPQYEAVAAPFDRFLGRVGDVASIGSSAAQIFGFGGFGGQNGNTTT